MNIDAQQAIQILISFITTQNENWSMSSIPFMLLFMVFMIGYLLFSGRIRSVYVVLFSLFFAFKANDTLMWLLPANALLSWFFTRRMMLFERGRRRIFGLAAVIIIELLPLLYFKYTNFFLAILGDILKQTLPSTCLSYLLAYLFILSKPSATLLMSTNTSCPLMFRCLIIFFTQLSFLLS